MCECSRWCKEDYLNCAGRESFVGKKTPMIGSLVMYFERADMICSVHRKLLGRTKIIRKQQYEHDDERFVFYPLVSRCF